jgi:hypothetical protein
MRATLDIKLKKNSMQNTKKNLEGFSPEEKKPSPNDAKVWFFEKRTKEYYEGLWIEAEDMFYIGFEDQGSFLYSFEVSEWGYL